MHMAVKDKQHFYTVLNFKNNTYESDIDLRRENKAWVTLIHPAAFQTRCALMQKAAGAAGAEDDKSATPANPKMSDFRSKFEKFGGSSPATGTIKPGTPAPFRRNSAAADFSAAAAADKSSSSAAAVSAGKDHLSDLQKQLTDAEKSRVKDRQELLDKLASQKKEFDGELQEMKKKNKQVCRHLCFLTWIV